MKLRPPFLPQQLLSALAALGVALLLASPALGQGAGGAPVAFKMRGSAGGLQPGTLVGASANGIQIKVGAQTITLPAAQFEVFQMAAPAEYAAGQKAYASGDLPRALIAISSVADRYKGLPTLWAQAATSLLGDIYVATGDLAKAEAAYADFKKMYPAAATTGISTSEVGLARIAIAKKDLDTAKAKLEPIITEAMQDKAIVPETNKALAYSQAFLVRGQVKEAEGNASGALEDYLRTVTIFYHDPAAVTAAQQKADALRARDKDNPVTVP